MYHWRFLNQARKHEVRMQFLCMDSRYALPGFQNIISLRALARRPDAIGRIPMIANKATGGAQAIYCLADEMEFPTSQQLRILQFPGAMAWRSSLWFAGLGSSPASHENNKGGPNVMCGLGISLAPTSVKSIPF